MRHHVNTRVLGFILLATMGLACGATSTQTASPAVPHDAEQQIPEVLDDWHDAEEQISEVLDDWHDAAATAEEERYFSHFAPFGVFLGTDASERWSVDQFREYAHQYFERGRAWSFTVSRRAVIVVPGSAIAWFDENLESENLGPLRGSGVMVRDDDGQWRIAHYVLSFTIPNDRVRELRDLLSSEPP